MSVQFIIRKMLPNIRHSSNSLLRSFSGSLAVRPRTSGASATCNRSLWTFGNGSGSGLKQQLAMNVAAPSTSAGDSLSSNVRALASLSGVSCRLGYSTAATNVSAANKSVSEDAEAIIDLGMSDSDAINESKTRSSDEIWAAYEQASKSSWSLKDYTETLKSLANARDFLHAKQVFEEMQAADIHPDSDAFSYLLASVRRTLRPGEIRQLFGDASEHRRVPRESANDAVAESSSHTAYASASNSPFFEQVQGICKSMDAAGIRPSMWFYEDFANFLTAINQAGVLINLATAMEKRGERPSTKFYNRMLHCLPRSGLLDRASMLFNRMVLRGTADYYTYLVRASSLIYVNQSEAARSIISDMKGKFPMDSVAYNILIKSYLAQKNCEQALQIFQEMTRNSEIAPTRITCRTFISYFYESSDLQFAEPIIAYFPKAGFPETAEDYGNLIKFFARFDPPKVLELCTQLMAQRRQEALQGNYLIHAFLRILNDRRVTPDWKRTFGNLALELLSTGGGDASNTSSNAKAAVEELLKSCGDLPFHYRQIISKMANVDGTTYEVILKKLMQLRRYESIKGLFESLTKQGAAVSIQPVHRNLHLTALLSMNDAAGAQNALEEMNFRRIPVSGKNREVLEGMGMNIPRGMMAARKGQGVTSFQKPKSNPMHTDELNVI